jgi:hypothetical protein
MRIKGYYARYSRRLMTLIVVLSLLAAVMISTPVQAAPMVTLTPSIGAVGTMVTITGTVFESYKGDYVHIFFDNTEIDGSPMVVPDTGTFTIQLTIPGDATPGRHWVRVRSEVGSTTLLAENFFIVEEAGINLDIFDGPVGTSVTITGKGFYSGRTVTLYYYNILKEKIGTETASPTGEFSYRFIIPDSTGGVHKISAANAEGNSAEIEFEVLPSIVLNLSSAGPGEVVNVRGTGFGHRSDVNISLATRTVATARTDDYGNFDVNFNVPELNPNPYDVKAEDEEDNLDKAKFTVTAGANLNQTTGSVGTKVTVRGTGFITGGTVTVDYDDLRVATATADNNGAFTATFSVPPGSSGSHVIKVSDGTTTKQFAFTVESEAPQAPVLSLPDTGTETRAKAHLDWQDSADPSQPVVYRLQIASDQNFSSLVLNKDRLTESEYTLAEEEMLAATLESAPYFWRVKATDSAGNEGEWSDPWSFFINAPATPSLLLPASNGDIKTPVFFNWQAVDSLSPPVTYDLQVATDLNFTSILMDIKGLAGSEHLLSEEDELQLEKEIPYYWRVRAIDSAKNESEWSAPSSFYISKAFSFPSWAIYTLIGIFVVLAIFLAFRIGRRTAYRPPD